MLVTQFLDTVAELQRTNQKLVKFRKARALRSYLKCIIIGFLIYKNIEQQIELCREKRNLLLKSMAPKVKEHLLILNEKIVQIEKSDTFLQIQDGEQILAILEKTKAAINYLRSENALDNEIQLAALSQVEQARNFITNYNSELEAKRARQELLNVRGGILEAGSEFKSKYDSDRYFSKKDLHDWRKKWSHLIQPIEEARNKGVIDVDFKSAIESFVCFYQEGEELIEKHNAEFIKEEIIRFSELFESLESYPLTEEQRRAIVIDEECNLIVAGAGSGKTSTIIGKVIYLIEKGLASPEDILLIAFNRDVASEMDERINRQFDLKLKVKTFHSLGLEIIAESKNEKPSISELAVDRVKLPTKILEFIKNRMNDEDFARTISEYFIYYYLPYKSMFEFNSYGEYVDYLRRFEIRSIKGDLVKSFEECDIANFLYINGVEYIYEKAYEVKTANAKYRQYKPDFFLPNHGIYIEHFGIDRDGRTAPYISQVDYHKAMKWKRNIHKENETVLIETYSYEKQEGTLLSNLEKKLSDKGVTFKPLSNQHIFDDLNELGRVSPFALLLSTFLNLYKSSNKTLEEIKSSVGKKDERTQKFLDVFSKIYEDYSDYLEANNEIDFNDMIIEATNLIKQGVYRSNFKYILVDEFQDISQSRLRFLKALLDQNNSRLFSVGDDWQSIYRFAGSDISIMLDFKKIFGFSKISYLQESFRFGEKLCDFSTKFILQNPNQFRKQITSKKRQDSPPVTITKYQDESTLHGVLSKIDHSKKKKESIFIMGRYHFLEPQNLTQIAKTCPELSIEFTTVHSSKGREADYVILMGLRSGWYGFPSQITDDSLLNLVLAREDAFPNAEERRLFYVAITRARKHVYLFVDENQQASEFITEIQQGGYEIEAPQDYTEIHQCPMCKTGIIIKHQGKYGTFHSCSNQPYCEYMPKECPKCHGGFLLRDETAYKCSNIDCSFAAHICPHCNDGYLVLRTGRYSNFYGCSNYPECNYILH